MLTAHVMNLRVPGFTDVDLYVVQPAVPGTTLFVFVLIYFVQSVVFHHHFGPEM